MLKKRLKGDEEGEIEVEGEEGKPKKSKSKGI